MPTLGGTEFVTVSSGMLTGELKIRQSLGIAIHKLHVLKTRYKDGDGFVRVHVKWGFVEAMRCTICMRL